MRKRSSSEEDVNEAASRVLGRATGEKEPIATVLEELKQRLGEDELVQLAAAILGREGGLKGGKARAEKLAAKERSEIARRAARARWRDHVKQS